MAAVESPFEITPLTDPPARTGGVRQELNQLTYGPSEVLVARRPGRPPTGLEAGVAGAVRLAVRAEPAKPHGFIGDLIVDAGLREAGLPEQLIAAAEARLLAHGVQKIDAVTVDGQGWASYYFRAGYWSSRRMVVLTWDLERRPPVERSDTFRIEQVDSPDPEATARFIVGSYQPYFRWWKETATDQKWDRVELQPAASQDPFSRAPDVLRRAVIDRVRSAGERPEQTFFFAYQGDALVGLCDARDALQGEDTFDWCVLVSRDWGGKGLGSTLLDHALEWLRLRGRRYAEYTSTSGLDDYDPLIYLATVATGAQIRGEFLNLVKNRL